MLLRIVDDINKFHLICICMVTIIGTTTNLDLFEVNFKTKIRK